MRFMRITFSGVIGRVYSLQPMGGVGKGLVSGVGAVLGGASKIITGTSGLVLELKLCSIARVG